MALRDVNLVPESVLQGRYIRRHALAWTVAYLVLAGALLGSYVGYTQLVVGRRRHAMDETRVRRRLATTIAQIDSRKEELERLAFVREVSCPIGASEVLGRLAEVMEPQAWLTDVSLTTRPGAATEIEMSGLARSNSRVGTSIANMSKSGFFRDVELVSSSELATRSHGDGGSEPGVQFSIGARAVME